MGNYKCSNCKFIFKKKYDFCPKCGGKNTLVPIAEESEGITTVITDPKQLNDVNQKNKDSLTAEESHNQATSQSKEIISQSKEVISEKKDDREAEKTPDKPKITEVAKPESKTKKVTTLVIIGCVVVFSVIGAIVSHNMNREGTTGTETITAVSDGRVSNNLGSYIEITKDNVTIDLVADCFYSSYSQYLSWVNGDKELEDITNTSENLLSKYSTNDLSFQYDTYDLWYLVIDPDTLRVIENDNGEIKVNFDTYSHFRVNEADPNSCTLENYLFNAEIIYRNNTWELNDLAPITSYAYEDYYAENMYMVKADYPKTPLSDYEVEQLTYVYLGSYYRFYLESINNYSINWLYDFVTPDLYSSLSSNYKKYNEGYYFQNRSIWVDRDSLKIIEDANGCYWISVIAGANNYYSGKNSEGYNDPVFRFEMKMQPTYSFPCTLEDRCFTPIYKWPSFVGYCIVTEQQNVTGIKVSNNIIDITNY